MAREVMWNTSDPVRASIHYNTFDEEDVEHVIEELLGRGEVAKEIVQAAIAMGNQYLYGKGSIKFGYWKTRPEIKTLKDKHPDTFAAGRQVFLRGVLAGLYFWFREDVVALIPEVCPLAPVPEFWVNIEAHRAVLGLPAENERARAEACKRLPTVAEATKVAELKRRKKGKKR